MIAPLTSIPNPSSLPPTPRSPLRIRRPHYSLTGPLHPPCLLYFLFPAPLSSFWSSFIGAPSLFDLMGAHQWLVVISPVAEPWFAYSSLSPHPPKANKKMLYFSLCSRLLLSNYPHFLPFSVYHILSMFILCHVTPGEYSKVSLPEPSSITQ